MEQGYTKQRILILTGIVRSDYSKLECGKRYLTFEQCCALAVALNTSMVYLAGLTDEKAPYPRSQTRPD